MNNFTFLKKFFLFLFVSMSLTTLSAQDPVGLEVVNVTSCPNNTVEVDIKATNWELVISMQFTIHWDPAVLSFTGTTPGNPVFNQIFFNTNSAPSGFAGASWFDPSPAFDGVTLDDEIVFTIAFDVIGELGECSPITFDSTPTLIEFTHKDGSDVVEFVPVLTEGNICLELPDVGSLVDENEIDGNGMGYLDLITSGGTAPYDFLWSNGATTESISNLSVGAYTCMVTDASGCSADLGPFSIENDITESINTIAGLNSLTLSPNPATEFVNLTVDYDQAEETTVRIYSLTGKVVYNHKVDGQSFNLNIPVNDFAKGAYFLELTTSNGKAVEKLIIAE